MNPANVGTTKAPVEPNDADKEYTDGVEQDNTEIRMVNNS